MTSQMSTHGLSMVESMIQVNSRKESCTLKCMSMYHFLVISVCFGCFQLVSIAIKTKLVSSVHEVHKWPAALIDS